MFSSKGLTLTGSGFRGVVVDTIDITGGVGTMTNTYPAITSDGATLFVSVPEAIKVIDTATNTVTDTINIATNSTNCMLLKSDDSILYVGTNLGYYEYTLGTETLSSVKQSVYYFYSQRPVFSADETKAWFAGRANLKGIRRLTLATQSHYLVPNSDDYYYFEAALAGTKLFATNGNNNALRIVNTTTETLASSMTTDLNYPIPIVASADGSTLYTFKNTASDALQKINASTETITGTFNLRGARSLIWHPDGIHLFCGSSVKLQVFDTVNETLVGDYPTITCGENFFAWHPDGKTLYAMTADERYVQVIQ